MLLLGALEMACVEAPPARAPVPPTVTIDASPARFEPAPPPAVAPAPQAPAPDRFAIASESAPAVEIARGVLLEGGSAIDALVAGALVGCAAHPSSCGLGGGGMALVWDGVSTRPYVVDFRETAPLGLKRVEHLGRVPPAKRRGVMVGVPGMIDGLATLHARGGRLPWASVVGRAADIVEAGLPVSPYLAATLALETNVPARVPIPIEALVGNYAPSESGKVANPALARALRTLATRGPESFYRGPLGAEFVAAARGLGSRMVAADLARYRSEVREPLRRAWEGFELITAPPPSGGGLTLLATLGTVARADLDPEPWTSASAVHVVAEALRGAHGDRSLFVGDPAFTRADLEELLATERLRARRARIRDDTTSLPKVRSLSESGTQQWMIVDEQGTVVSASFSVGSPFGLRAATKSGYVMNDALIDFAMDDYGARPLDRGANFPRGGARPATSACPTIVLDGGRPRLAIGGSGGLRGPTGVALVVLTHLLGGRPLHDAVSAPRFHVTGSGALRLEPALAPLEGDLARRGEVVETSAPTLAGVAAIALGTERGTRRLEAAFDPRRGGGLVVERARVRE